MRASWFVVTSWVCASFVVLSAVADDPAKPAAPGRRTTAKPAATRGKRGAVAADTLTGELFDVGAPAATPARGAGAATSAGSVPPPRPPAA